MNEPLDESAMLPQSMDALRARDAARLDPVRWRHIEALARRATAHQGAARRLIDDRLAQLLHRCEQAIAQRQSTSCDEQPTPAAHVDTLAALLAHLAQHTADLAAPPATSRGTPANRAPAELNAVRKHLATWTRLKIDQRLAQLQAQVPDNAGPLNTPRLLHEALTVMRGTSPHYAHRLMTQVETLLWLEQAGLPSGGNTGKSVEARVGLGKRG